MKTLNVWLFSIVVLLHFSTSSFAMCVPVSQAESQHNDPAYMAGSKALFYWPEANRHWDWVGDAVVGDGFYASGDIYIEYDYLLANQSKGLEFDQKGSLYLLPAADTLPAMTTSGFSDELGVAYGFDGPLVDYWITADSTLDVEYFFSKGNIYIVNSAYASEVPVPAAGWLFASSLFGLAWRGRQRR